MSVAYDIVDAVLEKLIALYTADMQTAIAEDDALRVALVDYAPLQQDPTTVAPFVVVGPDQRQGRILDPLHEPGPGMGIWWWTFFIVGGWVPAHDNKKDCYIAGNTYRDRMLRVLYKHPDLDGLVAGNGEALVGGLFDMVDRARTRVFGGDNEWFAEVKIEFHLTSEEALDMRAS